MKIQQISKQNFQGRIIYLAKNGQKHIENIQKKLPYMYNESQVWIEKLIEKEPFDIYISRGEKPLHFNIWATDGKIATQKELVKLEMKNYHPRRHNDYYNNPDDFTDAFYSSIRDYNLGKFQK